MRPLYTVEYDRIPRGLWGTPRRRFIDDLLPGAVHRYFALGRAALFWLCRAAGWGPGDRVLLPALICNSVVRPFRHAGLEVQFYLVRGDLTIDVEDLERRLGPKTRAALIVHYFGWPQSPAAVRGLRAKAPEVLWIEDLCHALLTQVPQRRLGSDGDVALASFRKFIPCPDGAAVAFQGPLRAQFKVPSRGFRYRAHALGRLSVMAIAGQVVRDGRHAPESLRWARRVLQRWRAGPPQVVGMDPTTRYLVERFDWMSATQVRRMNTDCLMAQIRDLPGVRLPLPGLPEGVVPLGLPLLVPDPARVHAALLAFGIEAPRLWPVPEGLPAEEVAPMRQLHEGLLCLPVREPYSLGDMKYIADALAAALRRFES